MRLLVARAVRHLAAADRCDLAVALLVVAVLVLFDLASAGAWDP